MKEIANSIALLEQAEIKKIELTGGLAVNLNGKLMQIDLEDVEITTEDVPGWIVASDGKLTVALDITISKELKDEGIARELVNKIQTIRKERGFDVTDKITIKIQQNEALADALKNNLSYICNETLANSLHVSEKLETSSDLGTEIVEGVEIIIEIEKI